MNQRFFHYIYIIIVTTIFFYPSKIMAQTTTNGRYTDNSVLSKGNWIKIKVGETGVYKLTYNDLAKMGISNPKNVQIYGYGGWKLDEDFSDFEAKFNDDLPQVAIWMSKPRADFSSGDYILFYAKGDLKWEYNETKKEFVHTQNPYSFDSYYFVTESDEGPLLMDEVANNLTPTTTVSSFTDYYLHEKELVNLEQTGSEFYGENFKYTRSQKFDVKLEGISSDAVVFSFDFISRIPKEAAATLNITNNNTSIGKFSFSVISSDKDKAVSLTSKLSVSNFVETNSINFTYVPDANTSHTNTYLNYFRINYDRKLKPYGSVTLFRSKDQSSRLGFKISEATDKLLIFDVTQSEKPHLIKTSLSNSELTFTASNTAIREYAMVNIAASNIPTPTVIGKIQNQDLHGLESKDMVIIVQPYLKKYAQQLADIHYADSELESLIITPEEIYNEFSSGKPDITAYRRFLKMFYDRASGKHSKYPQYLLLFGDGVYDNRFILSKWTETDKKVMLLTYQTLNSINEEFSYTTDDYIGYLDDNEGVQISKDRLDIGIGRIPARSESEAATAVKKINEYINNSSKGIWKNNIAFYADDALSTGTTFETQHAVRSDRMGEFVKANHPEYIVNKIYQDSYERVVTANGARYPDATQALLDKINSGLLVLNYVGHGSTRNWTHEHVLTYADVQNMTNSHLPFWITATCDYGRFDAYETSAAEVALFNSKGGAIALLSTVRVVYMTSNENFNDCVLSELFLHKEDNKSQRLGDVIRNAKLKYLDKYKDNTNSSKFLLYGDPALRLAQPDDTYKVKIKNINGIETTSGDIKIRALESNIIKGEIIDVDGNIAENFSGSLETIIFDSELDLETRGNKLPSMSQDAVIRYKDHINTIYTGNVNVENGEFTINFVTPKDILYSNGYGKMNFYAYDNTNLNEAQGSFLNYRVGGVDDDAEEDNNPPQILNMYLNSSNFTSGDRVNLTPTFYAEVKDDTGFNLSSGIGHNISLVIDGTKSYNLTNYFNHKDGTSKEGRVKFVIPELSEGKHTLQFKIWDSWNNSATESLEFEAVSDYKPNIIDFEILGNPAKVETKFVLRTDITGSNVTVRYQVYSITGALQWSHEESGIADFDYTWDLRRQSGQRLDAGIYICRITASINGKIKAEKSEKLIILGE